MSIGEFPLRLVASHQSETGIWRGRRGAGRCVAEGQLSFGGPALASLAAPDEVDEEVRLTALLCTRSLQLVLKRFENTGWQELVAQLADGQRPVQFVRDHDLLVDLEGGKGPCAWPWMWPELWAWRWTGPKAICAPASPTFCAVLN